MKPISGQILRLFDSVSHVYPLEVARNRKYPRSKFTRRRRAPGQFDKTTELHVPVITSYCSSDFMPRFECRNTPESRHSSVAKAMEDKKAAPAVRNEDGCYLQLSKRELVHGGNSFGRGWSCGARLNHESFCFLEPADSARVADEFDFFDLLVQQLRG